MSQFFIENVVKFSIDIQANILSLFDVPVFLAKKASRQI
jgi:hypothetical protein